MLNSRLKTLLMIGAAAGAAVLAATPVQAGQWWIFGNRIYNSGQVTATDDVALRDLLARARAQGITIEAVVFRNNPGGSAAAGMRLSTLIRQNNLATIFQGGCYSACATAFLGGTERGMATYDLPSIYTTYQGNTLGFHGGALGNTIAPPATQQLLLNFQLAQLGISPTSPLGLRLREAHFGLQDTQGFLRYRDPALTGDGATIFCPTGASWSAPGRPACTGYAGVDLYNDGLATRPGAVVLNDMLTVSTAMRGDLNPNFTVGELWRSPFGVVKIAAGGAWTLSTHSRAFMTWVAPGGVVNLQPGGRLGAGGEVLIDNGATINLQGGTLSSGRTWNDVSNVLAANSLAIYQHAISDTPITLARQGSVITGFGGLADNTYIAGLLQPVGGSITIKPVAYQNEYITGNYELIKLMPTSVTLLSVSPETRIAGIRNERSEVHSVGSVFFGSGANLTTSTRSSRAENVTPVQISAGATLAVNFQRGFYRPGQVIPLFEGYRNTTRLQIPESFNGNCALCVGYDPGEEARDIAGLFNTPYFSGHFTQFLRANDGARISLDPAALSQTIAAAEDSLLGFDLVYTPMADGLGLGEFRPALGNDFSHLNLIARPAFEETSLFAGPRSGDGLGVALRTASYRENPGISGLLGALQFSSRAEARNAAGALRGDSHGTQALLNQALIASLDDRLMSGRRRLGAGGGFAIDRALTAPQTSALGSMWRTGKGGDEGLDGLAQSGGEEAQAPTSTTFRSWGEVLVGEIRIDGATGVAAMDGAYQGLSMGAQKAVGRGYAGADLTYLTVDHTAIDESFEGDGELISASAHANLFYGERGDVMLAARLTRSETETIRSIDGIEGLEQPARGKEAHYSVSARVENAFSFGGADRSLRLLAPIVAYQRSSPEAFSETVGEFALRVQPDDLTSLRLGAGFEASRDFTTNGTQVTPRLRVAYERETADVIAPGTAAFVGAEDLPFDLSSREIGRDIVTVGLGLSIARSDRVAFSLDYNGRSRSGAEQHMGSAGLTIRF